MASPIPPAPNEVPETDATYERANVDPTLKREDAAADESLRVVPPPSEHQQAPAARVQQQSGRQQQQQKSAGDASSEETSDGASERSDVARPDPLPAGAKIAGSMKTEDPDGWDQAPLDITDPRQKRHPRPDGLGGSDPASAKRDPKR